MSIFDRLPQLSEPTRAAVARALIYIGVILSVAWLAQQSGLFSSGAPIAAELQMPPVVTLIKGADSLTVRAMVSVTNNTAASAFLEVPTPCHIFRWFVTTAEGEFIQSKAEEICAQVVMTATLPAGGKSEEEFEIALDPGRLTPGAQYIMAFRYWGQDGHAEFTAQAE